jgi:hypothetical protein
MQNINVFKNDKVFHILFKDFGLFLYIIFRQVDQSILQGEFN